MDTEGHLMWRCPKCDAWNYPKYGVRADKCECGHEEPDPMADLMDAFEQHGAKILDTLPRVMTTMKAKKK